jgi:hypothetical protein
VKTGNRACACSSKRRSETAGVRPRERRKRPEADVGLERIYTSVAALVDTNILVYRFDRRFPDKRRIATEILRRGIAEDSVPLPHQAIVEFIAAVTACV